MGIKMSGYLFLLAFLLASFVKVNGRSSQCNEDQISEAEFAFRNCEDSAKANIFSKKSDPNDDLCQILDEMFLGCEDQLDKLAQCKGSVHVEKIKKISLLSIANVLDAIRANPNGKKAIQCPILATTTTSTTTSTTSSTSSLDRQHRHSSQTSSASSIFFTSSSAFLLIAANLIFHWKKKTSNFERA